MTDPLHHRRSDPASDIVAFPGGGCQHLTPSLPEKLYIVRHGLSAWNRTRRVTGQLNPGLSPTGEQQALRLEQALRSTPLTAIYASTLDRAVETARPTARALGLEIVRRAELCEQHMGILEGRYRDGRDREAQRLWQERKEKAADFRIPGGESLLDVQRRVDSCLAGILRTEAGGRVLIVAHRNTNRALLASLLGWPISDAQWLRLTDKFLYEVTPGPSPDVRTISLREKDLGNSWEDLKS